MTEEALTAAQKQAKFIAQHHFRMRIGKATGIAMGIGLAGAMGSVILYSTAALPVGRRSELSGFREATAGLLPAAEDGDPMQQARVAAVVTAGAAAVGSARSAARRAV